ncbi:hypothetical protein V6N13_045470 [Hibiscus sabdariffa]
MPCFTAIPFHILAVLLLFFCFSAPIVQSSPDNSGSIRLPSDGFTLTADNEGVCARFTKPASCPVKCFRTEPVCGVDGVTYWCGCADAYCAGTRVAKLGFCEVGSGVLLTLMVCIGGAMVLIPYKGRESIGEIGFRGRSSCCKLYKEKWAIGSIFLAAATVFLLISVPSASQNWKDISMPIFQHCNYLILQCNSVSHHKFDYREGLHQIKLKVHHKANTIHSLQDRNGVRLSTFEAILEEFIQFFYESLEAVVSNVEVFPDDLLREILDTELSAEMQNHLVALVTKKEIKDVLFSMNGNKAPEPDGFSAKFF